MWHFAANWNRIENLSRATLILEKLGEKVFGNLALWVSDAGAET